MKTTNIHSGIGHVKSIFLDLAIIVVSSIVLVGVSKSADNAAFLFVPVVFASWYAFKDCKFRGQIVLRFILLSFVRSLFVLFAAISLMLILFMLTTGLDSETLTVSAICLGFTFVTWIISYLSKKSLFKAKTGSYRFDAAALSVAYDKTSKMLRIASKSADYYGQVPMPKPFTFNDVYSTVSTNTYATTSRGESITIHGTGSYNAHTSTNVFVSESISNSSFTNNLYDTKGNKYTFSVKLAKELNKVLDEIYSMHAKEMAPIYEAEKIQREELAKAATQKRKDEEEAVKEAAKQKILQNVSHQCTKLLNDWGIAPEKAFKTYRYRSEDGGYICTMLAADKEGRGGAVLNDGKDTWSGSWKNAQISEVGDTLEVQIDDPAYRQQNLKEHRFVIKYMDREQRVEWIDRIRILSAQA